MAFIRQKGKSDCGIATLAMLCDTTYNNAERVIPWRREGLLRGTDTKQLREGGHKLGYETKSTPQNRLRVLKAPRGWEGLPPPLVTDLWYLIPDNSLVKVKAREGLWHWVVWRKEKVYDPARGVFHPAKYGKKPTAYMQFIKEVNDG